jgi:hypothetical protein
MTNQKPSDERWVASCLVNDEDATDQDMREHFEANEISPDAARFYVSQRDRALRDPLNFTLETFGGTNQ